MTRALALLALLFSLCTTLRAADPPRKVDEKVTVHQDGDGTVTLRAIDATVHGTKAKLEKKGTNPHNIGYWTNDKDTVTWESKLTAGGKFEVELEYSLAANSKGAEIAIEFGEKEKVTVPLEAGKTFLDFKTAKVGQVELPVGAVTITVRPLKKPGVAVMDLRAIVLKPVKEAK